MSGERISKWAHALIAYRARGSGKGHVFSPDNLFRLMIQQPEEARRMHNKTNRRLKPSDTDLHNAMHNNALPYPHNFRFPPRSDLKPTSPAVP